MQAVGWIIATLTDVVVVLPNCISNRFELVGIDMPIGLIDGPRRACDIAARKFLGRAGSSVFPAPPRAALAYADYRDALAAARTATGRGISKQTFNIMRESRRARSPHQRDESAADHRSASRMLRSRCSTCRRASSVQENRRMARYIRRRLLADHFDVPRPRHAGAAIDDMLDAYAVSVERAAVPTR